jgi:SnoaL-like domain
MSARPSAGPTHAPAVGAPKPFVGYDEKQAAQFAAAWLPAWTGNDPERLASFYTHDTFYSDPEVPEGIRGHEALTAYLERLLARFPGWTWTQTDSAPMRDGFVNYWQARVPISESELTLTGVCLVELREGLIARNQVFFDRSAMLDAIGEQRTAAHPVPHGNDNPLLGMERADGDFG